MTDPPLLQAAEIGRRAPGGDWLYRKLSLKVAPGDRWAVTGPIGSGKTLLLRALALLDPVDEGAILWENAPVPDKDVPAFRRQVTFLHQRPVLLEGTVEENLRLPHTFHQNRDANFDREETLRRLSELGLDATFLDRRHHELSGGEAQIVALLRALQLEPGVLLLDEPTGALDTEATAVIERMVADWQQRDLRRRATVWVSHDSRQVDRVARQVLPIRRGGTAGAPTGGPAGRES